MDRTDPGMPLLPASDHWPLFKSPPSEPPQPSQSPRLANTFNINSSLPNNDELPNSSELLYWSGGCGPLPGRRASAGLLHLPHSRLQFHTWWCGSGGQGPLLWTGWEKHMDAEWLLKVQLPLQPCSLPQCAKTFSD